MWSYDTLDAIADSVNPVLLLITLIIPWIPSVKLRLQPTRWFASVAAILAVIYGLQFIDANLGLWAYWSGDYSTHSALAVSLVTLWFFAAPMWFLMGAGVFILYGTLMLYQQYHTAFDILTTVAVIAPLSWSVTKAIEPRRMSAH